MFFFEGSRCPVCAKEFKKDDDVVACPVCGTPHHRACYKENGGCAYEEKHAEGYRWQQEAERGEQEAEKNICSRCGTSNQKNRLWCEKCGAPLGDIHANVGSQPSGNYTGQDGDQWSNDNGYYSIGADVSIPDGELIDEVPAGDLKRFVKGSAYYYVPLFAAFERVGRKISLNILAFFTHGLWFLSRKMYALGGLVLAVQTAIYAYQCYCSVQLSELYDLYYSGDMTAAYSMMTDLMVQRPVLIYSMAGSVVLNYAILFGCGLFANWLYKEHCVKKVRKLNAQSSSAEEFNAALEARGGTALPLAIGCAVLYFAVRMFLQYLIQG